jgi:hypothetical protein
MGLTISRLLSRLIAKKEMRILMVRGRRSRRWLQAGASLRPRGAPLLRAATFVLAGAVRTRSSRSACAVHGCRLGWMLLVRPPSCTS